MCNGYAPGMTEQKVIYRQLSAGNLLEPQRLAFGILLLAMAGDWVGSGWYSGVSAFVFAFTALWFFSHHGRLAALGVAVAGMAALGFLWTGLTALTLSGAAALALVGCIRPTVEAPPAHEPVETDDPADVTAFLPRWFTEFSDAHGRPLYMRTSRNYIELCNDKHSSYVRLSMASAAEQIPADMGLRVHKEYYVLRESIKGSKRINSRPFLVLENGKEIPVGRSFAPQAKAEGLLD